MANKRSGEMPKSGKKPPVKRTGSKAKARAHGRLDTLKKGRRLPKKVAKGAAVEKFTEQQVIQAVQKTNGLLSDAARYLKCSRQTIYTYAKKYQAVRDALNDANETAKDFVESQLFRRIKKGDTTAIIFYLKTKAKDRGYVERQEHTGAEGGPIGLFDMNQWKREQERRLTAVAALQE